MTKLIIHIGLQKTGTTFLQQNFAAQAAKLRDAGVHFLSPRGNLKTDKKSAAHHWMAAAIRKIPNSYIPDVPFTFLPQYMTHMKRAIEASPHPVALISSENFSRMRDKDVALLRSHLEGVETEVVIYLRRQDLWIDSWYAQLIKTGKDADLGETVENMQEFMDFRHLINRWAENFGQKNIRIGVYENLTTSQDLWRDFFSLIDCPQAAEIVPRSQGVNVTLAPPLTRFIEIAQKATGYNPRLRRVLEKVNTQFAREDRLKFLGTEKAKALVAQYHDCNTEIAKTYLGRDVLFYNDVISGDEQPESISLEDVVQVVAGTTDVIMARLSALEKMVKAQQSDKPKSD